MLQAPPSSSLVSQWLGFLTPIAVAVLALVQWWVAKQNKVVLNKVAAHLARLQGPNDG